MAQAVSTSANILNILKYWYTDKRFESLLFRNSPTVSMIEKSRIGGKAYNFAAIYGRGGAVAGDYTVAIANAANTASNAEFSVPPGKIFSVFNLTQLAMMAGVGDNGTRSNYVKPLVNQMFAATEAARKTFALALFGSGFGEISNVGASGVITVASGSNTINLPSSAVIKMDVGTTFVFTNSTGGGAALLPSGPLRTSVNTVTAVGSALPGVSPPLYPVTFTATANDGLLLATDWLELQGSRDGGGNPQLPTGLGGWIPTFFNRQGAAFTTYIGTAFYGVNRSLSVDRLAGNFYLRGTGEKCVDALMEMVRICRRSGGVPNLIVVNDVDMKTLLSEVNGQTQYFQNVDKKTRVDLTKGAGAINFQFESSFLDMVISDPYCPEGVAYVLDKEVIEFAGISNTTVIQDDGVPGNEPGRPDATSVSPPETDFKLLLDDWLNVIQGTDTADGPAVRVSLSIYGNFAVRNPANCGAVRFY